MEFELLGSIGDGEGNEGAFLLEKGGLFAKEKGADLKEDLTAPFKRAEEPLGGEDPLFKGILFF